MPTKVHLIKAMVFPVIMYGCESWTRKKAEGQIIDAFDHENSPGKNTGVGHMSLSIL